MINDAAHVIKVSIVTPQSRYNVPEAEALKVVADNSWCYNGF
jgi:hypothetical protein